MTCANCGAVLRLPNGLGLIMGLLAAVAIILLALGGGQSIAGMIAAVAAILTAALLQAFAPLRVQTSARGRCAACSYDLRGNTTGVCPECGASVSPRHRV